MSCKQTKGRVLLCQNDANPYLGEAREASGVYMLDTPLCSVVYDQGSSAEINRAELCSMYAQNRLSQNFVALYASDDNKQYSPIPTYCMMTRGERVYFFNFSVKARYLKIHFTFYAGAPTGFAIEQELGQAWRAYYSDRPLLDGGSDFAQSKRFAVQNEANETVYDRILRVTPADLGIPKSALKEDLSDIRFRTQGYELPHYCRGGVFYVRVMQIPPQGKTDITVLYGNADAADISCGEAALEVEYGTKWAFRRYDEERVSWRNSVTVMPNGDLHRMGKYDGYGHLGYERSRDAGHTWEPPLFVPNTTHINEGGAYIVDKENGVVFYLCYGENNFYILRSDDNGYSWSLVQTFEDHPGSVYADGIKLSCFDGDGDNVDYVFHACFKASKTPPAAGEASDFAGVLGFLYSRDGGKTWQESESHLRYGSFPQDKDGNVSVYWTQHESGMTESSLWEKNDGTLVAYSRYQGRVDGSNQVDRFVMSYSYDHGVTWAPEKLSRVRTTETQPIIIPYEGKPVLMWGGNNVQGFRSYDRFPLSIGYSLDEAETFVGIQDLSHQTVLQNRLEYRPDMERERLMITNPDICVREYGGVDHANLLTTSYFFHLENFHDYLFKTKGAYDSFESGSPATDGWVTVSGIHTWSEQNFVAGEAPKLTEVGATAGKAAMHLGDQTEVSRSVPYVKKGEVFFDLYATSLAGGFTLELQSSYTRNYPTMASPVRIRVESSGEVTYCSRENAFAGTGLFLLEGQNSLSVLFDGEAGTASVSVNGKTASACFNTAIEDHICFVHMRNGKESAVEIDSFGLADLG